MKSIAVAAGVIAGGFLLSSGAFAKEYTIEVTPDHRKCYQVEYVPATYLVNTRGKLVRGVTKNWSGEFADGAIVAKVKNPAVYIQKRKLLESDHYSLRPVGCR